MKRLIDIVLSLTAILILTPLLIPICIILLLTGEHKVFYLQERGGFKNKKFKIIKFATMLSDSPNMGTGSLTTRNDPRVLPFGKFLRKSKINELPQIFNIFIGNMSIVGPRPQMEVDFKKYSVTIQNEIYDVKPGLTGIGSIIFRDEENLLSSIKDQNPHAYYEEKIAPYKGEVEVWYKENISIILDLKLIFITIWVVLYPKSNILFSLIKGIPRIK